MAVSFLYSSRDPLPHKPISAQSHTLFTISFLQNQPTRVGLVVQTWDLECAPLQGLMFDYSKKKFSAKSNSYPKSLCNLEEFQLSVVEHIMILAQSFIYLKSLETTLYIDRLHNNNIQNIHA